MRVCDICKRPIKFPVVVTIKSVMSGRYEVCGKCAEKINRFIRFETAIQERRGKNG